MLCAKVGKCTCSTLYGQKNPVCIKILRAYTGIGDAETQTPGMLRKPGDLPQVCPRPNTFKRLATRDTLHGLRPNLWHRGLDGRIVPTPSDLSDKDASTKRYARRRKKMTSRLDVYILSCRFQSKTRFLNVQSIFTLKSC